MNANNFKRNGWLAQPSFMTVACASVLLLLTSSAATAAAGSKTKTKTAAKSEASKMAYAPQVNVSLNKSTLVKLPAAASRVSVGNPEIADVILLGSKEIYLLGKKIGATNIIVWGKNGRSTVIDVAVGMDYTALQAKLRQLLPGGRNIKVGIANDSLVLTGEVADATKVDRAITLAEAYAGKKIVNMLQVREPQQVMLEVKVAEVSKTLLDKLGIDVYGSWNNVAFQSGKASTAGILSIFNSAKTRGINIANANHDNELVKILAEPTIMALSGQEGAFLAGGRIYIPVPQSGAAGATFTLEEKEFGVGLKFTPTVLENGLINLRVTPEVSELSSTGTQIATTTSQSILSGVSQSSLLPTISTRRASTTVQLYDGQSFAIGGLIKGKVTESMKALPGLGELPVLGALFRSSEFQNEKTELLFVITPRLVKPLPPNYALPTDNLIVPDRNEFFFEGKMEGSMPMPPKPAEPKQSQPALQPSAQKQPNDTAGFQMK